MWIFSQIKSTEKCITIFFLAIIIFAGSAVVFFPNELRRTQNYLASVFFVDSSTPESLKEIYRSALSGDEKLKILIVPGHDDASPGAVFGSIRESEINAALGQELLKLFQNDPAIETRLTRSSDGYDPVLAEYFFKERDAILAFRESQTRQMRAYVTSGDIASRVIVEHNFAPSDVALKLYGVNKWANENGYDILIHIHVNDVPRANLLKPGLYSGFSLYIPERQYSNAKGSRALAESIYERLSLLYPQSDLPGETIGIVEDQELIAIGSNNSLDASSILIEYAYIYEPIVQNAGVRELAIRDMALQTYLGIQNFFGNTTYPLQNLYENYPIDLLSRGDRGPEVLALQGKLTLQGLYPPPGYSKNDCPLSGYYGLCTEEAVRASSSP